MPLPENYLIIVYIEYSAQEILTILGFKTNFWFFYGRLVWKHKLLLIAYSEIPQLS